MSCFNSLQLEPIITPGNEGVVHHFVLSLCQYGSNLPAGFDGEEFMCLMNGATNAWEGFSDYDLVCPYLVGLWAVGGEVCDG